jgi:predicted transglutaminase-like cysteine proteinase
VEPAAGTTPTLVAFAQPQRQQATVLHLLPLFRMAPVTMQHAQESAWPRLIAQVNTHVNRHVKQVDDMRSYGRPDVWRPAGTQPGATGDCEDLALEKRRELIASGFPAARLFMAIAFRQDVGLHAVLIARLEDGDRVLDSHDTFVRPVARTGYAWLSLQQPGTPDRWFYPA